MIAVAATGAILGVLTLAACYTNPPGPEPSPLHMPRPDGHGVLRWESDVAIEGEPSSGLASGGYVLMIPMEAHDQWWIALGWGPQPMVDVEYRDDGRISSPYGMFQHIDDRVSLDLLDQVAEFGTVSEVSKFGYFPEPKEPGLYWACPATEYDGLLWVSGCDIALLGDHYLELTEHMGDVTATSENKSFEMGEAQGWSNIPGYNSTDAPE